MQLGVVADLNSVLNSNVSKIRLTTKACYGSLDLKQPVSKWPERFTNSAADLTS